MSREIAFISKQAHNISHSEGLLPFFELIYAKPNTILIIIIHCICNVVFTTELYQQTAMFYIPVVK